jgi:outer membrane protein OmpU
LPDSRPGISYIPQFENGGDNNSALKQAGIVDANSTDSGQTRGITNGWAGGLNFDDTFGDFGVEASGGILWAQSGSGFANLPNRDLLAYNTGAQFSFAGFSVGGAWLYVPQGQRTATTRFNGQSWSVGAAYEFGAYKIGLDYMYGDNNKTPDGGKDRLEQAVISGTRVLGPGIRLVGGVFYYDWEEENKLSQNKDGIGGATAIKLSF